MNSLLEEQFFPVRVFPSWKGFVIQGSRKKVIKVVSLCTNDGKQGGIQKHLEMGSLLMLVLPVNCLALALEPVVFLCI